jgi:rod shape-determining protein MreC
VFKGQAILDAEGIVGQVFRVNPHTAEAILISDAEHAIPVQSNRSGVRTIAVGTGDPDTLSLPFVTVEADLRAGDLLLTTGIGGVFPPGYPVAEVTKVEHAATATFAKVEARPTARLDRVREVLLVWFRPPVPGETPAAPSEEPRADTPDPPPARPTTQPPAPQPAAAPAQRAPAAPAQRPPAAPPASPTQAPPAGTEAE